MQILIGADPEVFVQRDGAFVSAYGLLPGTKAEPFEVPDGAVQVDGMAAEFNIHPAATEIDFVRNVTSVYKTLGSMMPGTRLVATPVAMFDKNYFDAQPKAAKELGCDPDFSAWTGTENPRPMTDLPMRTGSGHIHIGFTEGKDVNDPGHRQDCIDVAKQMDYYLGLPSMKWDTDGQRRKLYGRAGCFRVKPYGVEYRTLSNKWLTDPKLIAYVFRAAKRGVEAMADGDWVPEVWGDAARRIIDGNRTDWEFNNGFNAYSRHMERPPAVA